MQTVHFNNNNPLLLVCFLKCQMSSVQDDIDVIQQIKILIHARPKHGYDNQGM